MKMTLLTAIFSLLASVSFANPVFDKEVVISVEELPVEAQKFLRDNFSNEKILSVVCESDITEKDYYVYYDGGMKVKFDRKGNWESVENEMSCVPDSVVPANILSMIRAKHPEKKVTSISRDTRGDDKGYEVELDRILDMQFDLNGRFMRYDD